MERIQDEIYERADRESIKVQQFERLQEMLRHVARTNPFYAERWRNAGVDVETIRTLEDFRGRVPMVEKKDFVADQLDHPPFGLRLDPVVQLQDRVELYTTSGTSGQGVEVHAQTERELRAMEEVYAYHFRWAGLERGDRALFTIPLSMFGGGRIEWQGATSYGLTVLPTGNDNAERKVELIDRFQPRALYGSTSYFGHLAAIGGTDVAKSVDTLLTGLEGAGYSYLQNLQEQWGARVYDRFGCTQMRGDFMFACERGIGTPEHRGLLHNLDPFVLTEVVDPETGEHVDDGEFGEIVVTSLYHWDNPVVRNRLRDGGVWHRADYCTCGRPFDGLEITSFSRTDDVKKIKGVLVYPQAVDDVVFGFDDVDEYMVSISSSPTLTDVVTVKVMPKTDLGAHGSVLTSAMAAMMKKRIGLNVDIELVSDLARSEYKARRWIDER